MNKEKYISSGILELYVLDQLSEKERREVEENMVQYDEIRKEVEAIESALLIYCTFNSRVPPPGMKDEIITEIIQMRLS